MALSLQMIIAMLAFLKMCKQTNKQTNKLRHLNFSHDHALITHGQYLWDKRLHNGFMEMIISYGSICPTIVVKAMKG